MPALTLAAPFGLLHIHWEAERLTGIDLDLASTSVVANEQPDVRDAAPAAIIRQLRAYFDDGSMRFDLPLALIGTPFQQRVWALLQTIPPGETRTYGAVAHVLGSAARAVGQACRANPCLLVVPCHRVVAAQGLGGFSGDVSGRQIAVKRWLLAHEGVNIGADRDQATGV